MRSKLFVPGSRPELFAKAISGSADALSIDLEDAVAENRKGEARVAVGRFLRELPQTPHTKTIIVRVNALDSVHFEADLAAVLGAGLDLVNLPKAESAGDIHAAVAAIERIERERGLAPVGILANIESPKGLRLAAEIACAHPRVAGLQIGFADLFEPLGIRRDHAEAVRAIQMAVRLAAGEAGIWACDAAFADINDPEGYQREAEAARSLGFIGKSCIHPSQVPLANTVFTPPREQLMFALRILEAAHQAQQKGQGAFTLDGRMVDAPFVRRAEQLVELAVRMGLLSD